MVAKRHIQRSLVVGAALLLFAGDAIAQTASVQKLLERGALQEAVQQAETERDNEESTYLAAQAFIKMDNSPRANTEYARLRERGDDSWKAIGESGAAFIAGDVTAAMAAANRAVAANGENPYAHYQVGLIASRQNNFQRAADAFSRSVELKPDLAYGHYYAGLAHQRMKQMAQMSEHFEAFMRLAPEAPERVAVAAILRTLRP